MLLLMKVYMQRQFETVDQLQHILLIHSLIQSELVSDVAVPVSVRQVVLFQIIWPISLFD